MNILEKVKALQNGKGIQYLLDSAYEIFENPAYMVDAYYNMLAHTENPINDPYWNAAMVKGTFPTNPLMDLIDKEDLLTVITASKKSALIQYEKWEHGRMTGHIFNRDNNWVGQITMHAHIPFDEDRIAAFEMLAEKISVEIYDYEYFNKLPIIFHNDTINKFLDKSIDMTLRNIPQTQVMYYGLGKYLNVAVVSIERNRVFENVFQNRLAYFRSLLKTKYKSFKYAIHADHIVMLMSAQDKDFYQASFFAPNKDFFAENDLHIGISDSFENLLETRRYYEQAFSALVNGMSVGGDQRVFFHSEVR